MGGAHGGLATPAAGRAGRASPVGPAAHRSLPRAASPGTSRREAPRVGGGRPAAPSPVHGVPTRRRGDTLEKAIRASVVELLAEVGYAALTMDLVATRAQTGKATLYRRWAGKVELVVDAVTGLEHDLMPEPDTGAFRDDVYDLLRDLAALLRGPHGAITAALVSELPRHHDLAAAFRAGLLEGRRDLLHRLVVRGIERGEVRPDAPWPLLLEIGPAMLLTRHLVSGEPPPDAYVREVVDEIIVPLARPDAGRRP